MQTILYRCGLMLAITITVSISFASDEVSPGCVNARTDAFQKSFTCLSGTRSRY